jgi:SAM-dependent methyltransferase
VKRALLRLLERTQLLRPAFSAYERVRGVGGANDAPAGAIPLPPRRLVVKVAGTADMAWFIRGGELAAESIRAAAERAGRPVEGAEALLDFGCGCGRVMRHWSPLGSARVGTDVNAEAVAWCNANLPFARFATNELAPPLPFEDESFDLAYALSVFTHLTEPLQRAWLAELHRVLRPGALLLVSTHGDASRDRLDPVERGRYDSGEVVVRWEQVVGTNLCASYHPSGALERLANGFAFVECVPEGAKGNPQQDLSVLRKP